MKREKFIIATPMEKSVEVTGYRVCVTGYEELALFAHHCVIKNDEETISFSKDWTISEETTGRNCMPLSWPGGYSNKSIAGSIAIVQMRFEHIGKDCVMNTIAQTPKVCDAK